MSKNREVNGVLILDKCTGLSSNLVLQKVKRLFFAKKAGHTGTLDPLASGILPICFGQATKVAGFLLKADKRYFVRAKLGQTTDTGDIEGKIIAEKNPSNLTQKDIKSVVNSFVGNIKQVPPMYSALKKNGVPLYSLARKGISIKREPRDITIYKINFIDYQDNILTFDVFCSKGSYIRTLVTDIGDKLSCGAHVIELRRTGFAHIDIANSIKFSRLEELKNNYEKLDKLMLPSDFMLANFDSVYLNERQSSSIKFLGIGECKNNEMIVPERLFI